ncbi:MAG: phenylacetate-CoA oxygenase subunit PaaJ [Saprospiraceae bacterium]|nr:phenylacetate-CoA oxygenase subunit PaaJ [Saprospiraceae bacterium]
MTTSANDIEKRIWERLEQIPDPEVPVITITELGVVRGIDWDGDKLTITITPTYTGCPAMTLFTAEIRAAMHAMGFQNLDIKTVYSPAWTTDWLSDAAREKLRRYGIAPPVKTISDPDDLFAPPPAVPCPHCGSDHTHESSRFGSTACKALYVCDDCKEPFEYFKHF